MNSKKILIISNRVLSTVDNNGKTLYSFIKSIPKESVSQLYFYGNPPTIAGYNYFQLSDKDIILGKFNKRYRGRKIKAIENGQQDTDFGVNTDFSIQLKYKIPRNNLFLLLREIIWMNSWKSKQLDEWLGEIKPELVFFMAGDCLYAYRICEYVVNRFHCRLKIYVTDDYVLPRSHESKLAKIRRERLIGLMRKSIKRSQTFFTISERMREEYKVLFGKDSTILFNMSESLRDEELCRKSEKNEIIILTYTGSLYYGRDKILLELAKAIKKYNDNHKGAKRARLYVYSNMKPDDNLIEDLKTTEAAMYGGSLNKEQLKERLNLSNILVFVESFDREQVEKTKLSFSTKIPEYLSLGKPILAVGPKGIGSMDYLEDVAVCIREKESIYELLEKIVTSVEEQNECSRKALNKYEQGCTLFRQSCMS